jgi:hypothetical protein
MMTFQNILTDNKDVFVSMINKFLDTLYDKDDGDVSAPMYEELRRAIIDGTELTSLQKNLLLILVTFYVNKFTGLVAQYTQAVDQFTIIKSKIEKILMPNT